MRVLGFSKRWQKLSNPEFSTFRFPRRDRDWKVGEIVQIVYKPRSKEHEVLQVAIIIGKEPKQLADITREEAIADGFNSRTELRQWMTKTYGRTDRIASNEPMNKLTLIGLSTAP